MRAAVLVRQAAVLVRQAAVAAAATAAVTTGACLDAIPPGGDVLCARNDDCAPRICALARHVCVDKAGDTTAPKITAVAFEPAVNRGGTATLSITADEALDPSAPALVTFAPGTPALTLAFEAAPGATQRFLVDGDTAVDGVYPLVSVGVTDLAGNAGTFAADGVRLVIDHRAPSFVSASVTPADALFSDARAPSSIHVDAVLDEVPAGATATLAGVAAPCTVTGVTIACDADVVATTPDHTPDIVLDAVDAAGNAAVSLSLPVQIDTAPPGLVAGSVAVDVPSSPSAASVVSVRFVVDEDAAPGASARAFNSAGASVDLALSSSSTPRALAFTVAAGALPPDALSVEATVTDLAGHAATLPIVDALTVPLTACALPPGDGGCVDLDGDGHAGKSSSCPDGDDLDDDSPFAAPGALEIPGNGVDDDFVGGDQAIDESIGDFVDSEAGNDGGTGTRAQPFRTLDPALASLAARQFAGDGLPFLFLVARTTPYALVSATELTGVNVIGGLDPATFTPVVGARSTLSVPVRLDESSASVLAAIDTPEIITDTSLGPNVVTDVHAGVIDLGNARVLVDHTNAGVVSAAAGAHALLFDTDMQELFVENVDTVVTLLRSTVREHAELSTESAGASLLVINSALIGDARSALVFSSPAQLSIFRSTITCSGVAACVDGGNDTDSFFTAVGSLFIASSPQPAVLVSQDLPLGALVGNAFVGLPLGVVNADSTFDVDEINAGVCGPSCAGASGNVALTGAGLASVLHLAPSSPARDGGTPFAPTLGEPTSVAADFDGDCRFADGQPDFGADEVP